MIKKLQIFRNAYNTYHSGEVYLIEETDTKLYYRVVDVNSEKEHYVTLEFNKEKKVVHIRCECTISSVKSCHDPMCSHKIAVLARAMYDLGRRKKK